MLKHYSDSLCEKRSDEACPPSCCSEGRRAISLFISESEVQVARLPQLILGAGRLRLKKTKVRNDSTLDFYIKLRG
jgi:hypothetical protein